VIQYLDILEFISLLLRAASFSFLTFCVGGTLFRIFVASGKTPDEGIRKWVRRAAILLAITELLRVALNSLALNATTEASFFSLFSANYFQAGVWAAAAAVALAVMMSQVAPKAWMLLSSVAVLLATEVMTSHSAARLDESLWPKVMTAVHLGAAALWVGGLPFLLLSIRHSDETVGTQLVKRFTKAAIAGVIAVAGSGVALSLVYIDSWGALYGTAYGYMVLTKVVLFGLTLLLGAVNNRVSTALPHHAWRVLRKMSVLSEAEIGIGFTVVLAAASLTSQPPAIDLQTNRLTLTEIWARFRPEPPLLTSPQVVDLSPTTSVADLRVPGGRIVPVIAVQSKPADKAWSEYNHHWAGIIVAAMGLLALLSRVRYFGWARHWPLMFLGLAAFILLRADPENWPLGPHGFWESFLVAEVAQHRFYALLIVFFAAFEWAVQTGRIKKQWPALVFPLLCSAGGALLMTHTHSLGNIKEELLAEMSHTPIAIAGLCAGWARWLELRLPDKSTVLGYIWPASLTIAGVILILYRES
jgi:putative copper resistance protein D